MLASANVRGHLGPLIAALRKRTIILVGPAHLRALDLFPITQFIEVPLPGAADVLDRTDSQAWEALTKHEADHPCILWSSGMATNVSMWRLGKPQEKGVTMLDCGAIWDPYVGVYNRRSYRLPEVQALIATVHKEVLSWKP